MADPAIINRSMFLIATTFAAFAKNAPAELVANHLLIRDLTDEPGVVKTAVEYEGKENVIIENLTNCVVILPFSIKCLYVKNIKQTRI